MATKLEKGYCSIADTDCKAPAAIKAGSAMGECDPGWTANCYYCDNLVCVNCSNKIKIKGKERYVCRDCQINEKVGPWASSGNNNYYNV